MLLKEVKKRLKKRRGCEVLELHRSSFALASSL
jgi:hypothetical protein